MKLTARQRRFVDEYLIDLNATQAAIRAGYSLKTAGQIGEQNLRKLEIQKFISERMKAREQRTEITQDYVINTIVDTIERCKQAKPVVDKKGEAIYTELSDGSIAPAYSFEPNAVLKGAELLGKHLKMFIDRVEHGNPGDFDNLTDDELNRKIADAERALGIAQDAIGTASASSRATQKAK